MQFNRLQMLLAACSTAILLAACGGGGDAAGPKAPISRVFVMGDSLADVGTFGFKFTVQNTANPTVGYPTFTQLVAQSYGVNSQCNFYRFNGATFIANPTPGCTNFAIGNGHIQNPASQGGAAGPQSIPLQLATAGQAYGTFTATDLFIVDGGGNDFGDLVAAYLGAGTNPAGYAAFVGTLGVPLGGGVSAEAAAVLYMQALADKYFNAIKVNLIDRGATHVGVLNMPDVTLTPSFAPAMAAVSGAAGGGATGTAAAAQFQGLARTWITAFNSRLAADAAGNSSIALVDFFADLTDQVAHPADYGLTNVTQGACLVALSISTTSGTCTDAALSAAPPAGLAANWWTTWALADGLHPTPYGHHLLAASVSRALARAGWL